MNNALLVSDVSARLVACGFHVFAPAKVPAGDRGIARAKAWWPMDAAGWLIVCLGVPGRVIEVLERDGLRMGTVDFGGVRRSACRAVAPDVVVGDFVLVHVGFAISVIDEAAAARSCAAGGDGRPGGAGRGWEAGAEPRREVRGQYRDPRRIARRLLADIRRLTTRPWTLMEVCGGQLPLIRQGIDQVLPPEIRLVHGPGCPVCVTP